MKYLLPVFALILLCGIMYCNNLNSNELNTTNIVKPQNAGQTDKQLNHKDSLKLLIDQYYELNLKVFQKNSTVEDIDNIFNLFTDDFVYIHPKYGGTYTRKVLYDGYKRNQKNGGYDGSTTDIRVDNMIIGLNAVVTQKRFIEGSEIGESQMTLFEMKEGKISKIFEYW